MEIGKNTQNTTKPEAPNVGLSGKVFGPVVKWFEGKAEKIHELNRGLAGQLAEAESTAGTAISKGDRKTYHRAYSDINTLDRKIEENNKKSKWYSVPAKILHELGVKDRGYVIPSVAAKAGIKDKNWGSLLLRSGNKVVGVSPYKVEHNIESNLSSANVAPIVKTAGGNSIDAGLVVENGNNSVAVGAKVKTGNGSLAIGADVEAGNASLGIGANVKTGNHSVAAGVKAQTGNDSTAIAAHGTTGDSSWNLSANGTYNAASRAYNATKNFLGKTFTSKPKPEGLVVQLPLPPNNDLRQAA